MNKRGIKRKNKKESTKVRILLSLLIWDYKIKSWRGRKRQNEIDRKNERKMENEKESERERICGRICIR